MGRNDQSILAFYCVWRWGFQGPHLLTNGDGAVSIEITIAVRNILDLYEIHDVILDLNKRDMMWYRDLPEAWAYSKWVLASWSYKFHTLEIFEVSFLSLVRFSHMVWKMVFHISTRSMYGVLTCILVDFYGKSRCSYTTPMDPDHAEVSLQFSFGR